MEGGDSPVRHDQHGGSLHRHHFDLGWKTGSWESCIKVAAVDADGHRVVLIAIVQINEKEPES